jgi:hypothetical protein
LHCLLLLLLLLLLLEHLGLLLLLILLLQQGLLLIHGLPPASPLHARVCEAPLVVGCDVVLCTAAAAGVMTFRVSGVGFGFRVYYRAELS